MAHHRDPHVRPVRSTWGPWGWTAWALAVLAGAVVSAIASFYLVFAGSTTCRATATAQQRDGGVRSLLIAAAVCLAPWVAAAIIGQRGRVAMVVGGLVAVTPLLVVASTHLSTADWSGGFCF